MIVYYGVYGVTETLGLHKSILFSREFYSDCFPSRRQRVKKYTKPYSYTRFCLDVSSLTWKPQNHIGFIQAEAFSQ